MADRIELMGLEAYGYHGVFEHEKHQGQKFLVDIVVWTDFTRAAQTDSLADTISYVRLADIAVEKIQGHNSVHGARRDKSQGQGTVQSQERSQVQIREQDQVQGQGEIQGNNKDKAHGRGQGNDLIEKLACDIADAIMELPKATAVEVTVHKPQAPIEYPFGDVRVVARRSHNQR